MLIMAWVTSALASAPQVKKTALAEKKEKEKEEEEEKRKEQKRAKRRRGRITSVHGSSCVHKRPWLE